MGMHAINAVIWSGHRNYRQEFIAAVSTFSRPIKEQDSLHFSISGVDDIKIQSLLRKY